MRDRPPAAGGNEQAGQPAQAKPMACNQENSVDLNAHPSQVMILLKSMPTISLFNPRFHFLFHGIADFSTRRFSSLLDFLSFFLKKSKRKRKKAEKKGGEGNPRFQSAAYFLTHSFKTRKTLFWWISWNGKILIGQGFSWILAVIHNSTGYFASGPLFGAVMNRLMEEFLLFKADNKGLADRSIRAYRDILQRFEDWLEGRDPLTIDVTTNCWHSRAPTCTRRCSWRR
ncbi:hypothetical protein JOS77_26925 [Chromobacterium haemolyticum]|nr:hypothetical protein JOS77_26925 [Chromobacterium haemolyticum]